MSIPPFAGPPTPEATSTKAGKVTLINPIAIQTANYSANPSEFIPVDTTSGVITVTLPPIPLDGTVIIVRRSIGATNNVVVGGGGARFQLTTGPTTNNLTAVGTTAQYTYDSGLNVWYITPSLGTGAILTLVDGTYLAKGELKVGTGVGTTAQLTVGADGTVLTADSSQTTGAKWATPTVSTQRTFAYWAAG